MKISLYHGSIFSVDCDAIICPSDVALSGSGGLSGQIHARGGELLQAECKALSRKLKEGEATTTSGGALPYPYIIHVVSPKRKHASAEDPFLPLRNAMDSILREASKKEDIRRIAIPLFSTGIGGYDLPGESLADSGISRYAVALLSAAAEFSANYPFLKACSEVVFVCPSAEKFKAMIAAYDWTLGKGIPARSRIHGSLLGGALGDALGYPVEFVGHNQSRIAEPIPDRLSGKYVISDDTQMTLFTACGALYGYSRSCMRGIGGHLFQYIRYAYMDWLKTQSPETDNQTAISWIRNIPELNVCRAPGNTCLTALRSGCGSIKQPANNSKGCGGVMRIAPVALYLGAHHHCDRIHTVRECAEAAALTHGHPLGWLSAAALGCIVYDLMLNFSLEYAVEDTVAFLTKHYAEYPDTARMTALLKKAMIMGKAAQNAKTDDLIKEFHVTEHLGEGWVGEEALALGLFAVAATKNGTMEDCLRCAVGHRGDSDSTGSIAGQIRGALLGKEDLPKRWLQKLELRDVIEEIADDLTNDCRMSEYGNYYDCAWSRKYLAMDHSTHIRQPEEEPPFAYFSMPVSEDPASHVTVQRFDHEGNVAGQFDVMLQKDKLIRLAKTKEDAHTGAPGFGIVTTPTFDPKTNFYTEEAGWIRTYEGGQIHGWYNQFSFTLLPNRSAHTVEILSDTGPVSWLGSIRRTTDWGNPLEISVRGSAKHLPWQVLGMLAQNLLTDVF